MSNKSISPIRLLNVKHLEVSRIVCWWSNYSLYKAYVCVYCALTLYNAPIPMHRTLNIFTLCIGMCASMHCRFLLLIPRPSSRYCHGKKIVFYVTLGENMFIIMSRLDFPTWIPAKGHTIYMHAHCH